MRVHAAQGGLVAATLLIAGCGSNVVVGPGGGNGGGGGASAGSTGSSASSTSGGSGCQAESDCPSGEVCLFDSGTCTPGCSPMTFQPCGQGLVCKGCATGSCPGCKDCVSACVPAPPGQCDNHDDCPAGSVCIFSTGLCALACDPVMFTCPTPELTCDMCATAACPMCQACKAACVKFP